MWQYILRPNTLSLLRLSASDVVRPLTAQSITKGWFQRRTEYLNQVLEIRPTEAEKHMESEI